MKDLRDIIENEQDECLILEVFEAFIKKANSLANRPSQGFGSATEQMKKDEWRRKSDEAQELLSKIMNELI
jgi:hypothetical protein